MATVDTKQDFELLLLRLERNHARVLRLAENLNSYKFEPKNYDCFTKLRDLRSGFTKLTKEQKILLGAIKNQTLTFEEASHQVEASLDDFKFLEQGIASYLLEL